MTTPERISPMVIWHNLVAGLTVSFVAISLGAAFGRSITPDFNDAIHGRMFEGTADPGAVPPL